MSKDKKQSVNRMKDISLTAELVASNLSKDNINPLEMVFFMHSMLYAYMTAEKVKYENAVKDQEKGKEDKS